MFKELPARTVREVDNQERIVIAQGKGRAARGPRGRFISKIFT